jgi:hypothetical protein
MVASAVAGLVLAGGHTAHRYLAQLPERQGIKSGA